MLSWLAAWYNWAFLLSFLVGISLVLVSLVVGGKDADAGIGKELPDGDLSHALADGLGKAEPGHLHIEALAFLGVGKAPLMILLEVLLLSFGLLGLLVNAVVRDLLSSWGPALFPLALLTASVGSVLTTRQVAAVIGRFAPTNAPTSRKSGEFTGQIGTAASLVTVSIGQVRVDPGESTAPPALLNACVDPEYAQDIPRGTEILVVGYDPARALYKVRPVSLD